MDETEQQRSARWFMHGMNSQERIEYLIAMNAKLRKQIASLTAELNFLKNKY